MRILAVSFLTILVTTTSAAAQAVRDIHTRPAVPPPEILDRLNLQLAWYVHVPTEGRRDGLFSVELAKGQLFVQTRSGLVTAIDKETGMTQWHARVGTPYAAMLPLTFNSDTVFVVNATTLYALNRATGQQRWIMPLSIVPRTPPLVDDDRLHLILGDRVVVYEFIKALGTTVAGGKGERLPTPTPVGKGSTTPMAAASSKGSLVVSDLPELPLILAFEFPIRARVERTPLVTPRAVVGVDETGRVYSLSTKYDRKELFETVALNSAPASPLAYYAEGTAETAYLATHDSVVQAIDLNTGKILWRFAASAPVVEKPIVTDNEVFVTVQGVGLYALGRQDGRPLWAQPSRQAQLFLAANGKFIYAADRSGRLLVLDRFRGTVLSGFDTHEYVVPVPNEQTDRIYLAANSGLIICLRDRDYPTPLALKKEQEALPKPKQAGKPGAKPAEKPKDKEDEKPDKDDKKDTDKKDADKKDADKKDADKKDADKKDADAPEKKGV